MRAFAAFAAFTLVFTLSLGESYAGSPLRASRSIGAPIGFPSACARFSWLCDNSSGREMSDEEAMSLLQKVNRQVNAGVTPATDVQTSGKSDYWSLPINNKGDCEDYALLKLKTLLGAGLASNKLALSVAIDHRGNNHVVLLVRLKSGDYVLDNLATKVKPWGSTGYTFLASQNFNNRSAWRVTLAGPRAGQFSGT
ncbi:transglutaminase-like cysteine peptidase [Rhizobium cauense]|uniref:transglutaminase-like cysteine peptidase n=1 Tax=Rhizobium cauense TaxID=1166683 RepID=UPI001C6E7F0D|nr:transglutaminase-like cysteine peptidase [Rhizobium cauense]MBW9117830.1 transglutaminase-like cysteine peptidase [Rhizobium cauense]